MEWTGQPGAGQCARTRGCSHPHRSRPGPGSRVFTTPAFQGAWKRILPNVVEVEDSTDFFKSGAASLDVVR